MPSGNGLNPFSIFGNKEIHENAHPVQGNNASGSNDPSLSSSTKEKEKIIKQGNMFNLFWIFGKRRGETNATNLEGYAGENINSASFHHTSKPGLDLETSPPLSAGSFILDINDGLGNYVAHSQEPGQGRPARTGTEQQTENNNNVYTSEQNIASRHFESIEILKCVVYGGLIESITSLGVVSSAVSSGATKLNIIALGLANVISGLFIIGHSLMDLKNDSDHHGLRYHGLLGRREHFLLHATIAILSFLIFGFMPPVMYGFMEIWEVGAASFACIFILAIAKAYVKTARKFSEYIKTILYYVMMAITVSGIAYVVGDQIKMLMERLGWFESSQVGPTFAPDMKLPAKSWSSY